MFFKRGKGNKSFGVNDNNNKSPPLDLQKHADFIRETQEELEKLLQKKKYKNSTFLFDDDLRTTSSSRDSIEIDKNKSTTIQESEDKVINVDDSSAVTESSSTDSKDGDRTPQKSPSPRKTLRRTLSLPSSSRVKSFAQIPSSFTPRKINNNNKTDGEGRIRSTTTIVVNSKNSIKVKPSNTRDDSIDENPYNGQHPPNNKTTTNIRHNERHQSQTKGPLSHKLSASDVADSVWEVICQQSTDYSSHFYERIKAPSPLLERETSISKSELTNCNADNELTSANNDNTAEEDDLVKISKKKSEKVKNRAVLQKQVARADLSSLKKQQQQPPTTTKRMETYGLERSPEGSLVVTKVLNIGKEVRVQFIVFPYYFLS